MSPLRKWLFRLGLGIVLLQVRRNAEAREHLEQAVTLGPNLVEARLNLVIALLRLGKNDEARLNFEQVLKLDPANGAAKKFFTSGSGR